MKKFQRISMILLILALMMFPFTALTHGSRTDSRGGYKNKKVKVA